MVGRFEDFLRDGAPLPALRCSKGQRITVTAITTYDTLTRVRDTGPAGEHLYNANT